MPFIALAAILVLAVGYRFYGAFVAAQFRLDDATPTPAVIRNDGVDFVPTRPFYLLGQHFSAIAAAGPVAGPILACQQFGWLPAILWICLGVVLIGAVHDLSTLVASVRHDARSIAEVIKSHLGPGAGMTMLAVEESPFAAIGAKQDRYGDHDEWVPFVAVDDVEAATKRALSLGATLLRENTRGPAGEFTVVRDPGGAALGLWKKA